MFESIGESGEPCVQPCCLFVLSIHYDPCIQEPGEAGSSLPTIDASGATEAGSLIVLTASGYKVKGIRTVDLVWSGVVQTLLL